MRLSTALLAAALLVASRTATHAQEGSSWIAVPGWINPDSAVRKGQAQPILGGLLYETGYPVTATLVSGAQMVGVDLMFRGAFRYHDSHGIAHGRSLATSASGFALTMAVAAIAKYSAPWAARQSNARRLAAAEGRARGLDASSHPPLAGLEPGDTVLARGAALSMARGYAVSGRLAAEDLVFRGRGDVASRADSAQPVRVTGVWRRVRSPNLAPIALGFVGGVAGAITLCAKQFEHCYPYSTMWGATTAGYGIGLLFPTMMGRTISTSVVPR